MSRAFVDIDDNPSDYRRVIGIIASFPSVVSIATILAVSPAFAQPAPPNSAGGSNAGDVKRPGRADRAVRIGIGTIGPSTLSADLRAKLGDATAAGLNASGAAVVPTADIARARAVENCSDSVCERRLARITDTQYWLRGTVQVDGSTYRMHLELVDAQTDSVAVARDDTCDICTESDAADLANVAASALKAALSHRQVVSPPAPLKTASTSIPASTSIAAGPIDQQKAPPESTLPAWRRWLAGAAFGGAVAAVAVGSFYVYRNNKETDCEPIMGCARKYDTLAPGLAWLGVGAALATSGILLLTLPVGKTDSSATADLNLGAGSRELVGSMKPTRDAISHTQIVISLGNIAIIGRF
jgi:hypothetical protein